MNQAAEARRCIRGKARLSWQQRLGGARRSRLVPDWQGSLGGLGPAWGGSARTSGQSWLGKRRRASVGSGKTWQSRLSGACCVPVRCSRAVFRGLAWQQRLGVERKSGAGQVRRGSLGQVGETSPGWFWIGQARQPRLGLVVHVGDQHGCRGSRSWQQRLVVVRKGAARTGAVRQQRRRGARLVRHVPERHGSRGAAWWGMARTRTEGQARQSSLGLASQGLGGVSRQSWRCLGGMARIRMAAESRLCMVRAVWMARQSRHCVSREGAEWRGLAVKAVLGQAVRGPLRHGRSGQQRRGLVSPGTAGPGSHGKNSADRRGVECQRGSGSGTARRGDAAVASHGYARWVQARIGRYGMAWSGATQGAVW